MPFLRPSLVRHAAAANASSTRQAARNALKARSNDSSLPTLPSCPTPSCACADMPPDLDIDRDTILSSTMPPYAEHLLISSGQADWKSKIEEEKGTAPWGNLVANVKSALGLKGQFHNPYHNVVVSTSSFQPAEGPSSQALLFPSFRMIRQVEDSEAGVEDFVRTFLLPESLHAVYDQHSAEEKADRIRDPSRISSHGWADKVHPITAPTILVCSHNSRDSRCGILGPLLHQEFSQFVNRRHTLRNMADQSDTNTVVEERSFASHPVFKPDLENNTDRELHPINVGMISHIGGHKFAGNVIIYIPPNYQCRPVKRVSRGSQPQDEDESDHDTVALPHEDDPIDSLSDSISPLAGMGIWYGRVEPKHVEGIVEQTIGHGRIIKDLFRGGITQDGNMVRLPLY